MKKLVYLIVSFILLISTNSFAQEINMDDLLDMNLEELLTIEIVSGSIMKQSIENSPIIIDIINKEQIHDFNADDLYELISYLPGIEMMETYFGRTVLNFRGVKNYNYTNKILLTVNGKPMFEPVNGSFFLESIPVNAIERIEVIRGQGGTLLGTNAYSGVINIVTANGSSDNTEDLFLKAGYGSYNTISANVNSKIKINEDAGIYVAASVKNSKGYPFNIKNDEGANTKTIDYKNSYFNSFLNFTYKDLSVDAGYMGMDKMKFGLTPNVNYSGMTDYYMYFASANYKLSVRENFDINTSVKFNRYSSPEGNVGYFPFKGFPGHDTSEVYLKLGGNTMNAEVQSDYKFSDKLSNISGVVYELSHTDEYEFLYKTDNAVNPYSAYLSEYKSYTVSAYTQFEYKPVKSLQAVVGARIIKDKLLKSAFISPRVGLIYSINDKYFLKALYGQGFRTPTFFERYVSTFNVLFGSEDLKSEKADNFDFVVEALLDKVKMRIDGYLSYIKGDITRIPTTDPINHGVKSAIYVNDPAKYLYYGAEYSITGPVRDNGYYGLNVSWQNGKNRETDEEVLYSSNITSNAWLNYKILENFSITPNVQYIGERKGKAANIDYLLDDYLLVNMNVKYFIKSFAFNLTFNNLLNKDYTYPEFVRGKIVDIPGGRDRSVRFEVSYSLF